MYEVIRHRDFILIRLGKNHKCASTTVDGGLRVISNVVFWRVKEFIGNFEEKAEEVRERLGVKDAIVFFTAVDLLENSVIAELDDALVVLTVGLRHPLAIGRKIVRDSTSTINIFAVINRNLRDRALLELIALASAAKAVALADLGYCHGLSRALGTVSDAIAVASTIDGYELNYPLEDGVVHRVLEAIYEAVFRLGLKWISPLSPLRGIPCSIKGFLKAILHAYNRRNNGGWKGKSVGLCREGPLVD